MARVKAPALLPGGVEFPVDLIAMGAGKGEVLHLVDVTVGTVTLCGRATRRNPRHVFIGSSTGRDPAESTCSTCRKAAALMED